MRHLSQKDYVRLLAHDSEKLSHLREHINKCDLCAQKFKKASNIIYKKSPYIKTLPEELLEKIIRTYKNSKNQSKPAILFKISRLPALLAISAVFAIAITIAIYIMFFTQLCEKPSTFNLLGTRIVGKKETNFIISKDDVLTTGEYEQMRIFLENRMEIIIFNNSILKILKMQQGREDKRSTLECIFPYGKLHTKILDKTCIRLSINTPHGKIVTINTEFFVQVNAQKALGLLKEGTLEITHL